MGNIYKIRNSTIHWKQKSCPGATSRKVTCFVPGIADERAGLIFTCQRRTVSGTVFQNFLINGCGRWMPFPVSDSRTAAPTRHEVRGHLKSRGTRKAKTARAKTRREGKSYACISVQRIPAWRASGGRQIRDCWFLQPFWFTN